MMRLMYGFCTNGTEPTKKVQRQQLAFAQPIQPQQAGYIYVWACQPKLQRRLVSNETQGSKVWFDDVKVTHTYSRVTQASDYYAFGSVMREQKSPDDLVYRYGYQGEYSEKDLETGWNHFELREWDATIGRWLVPDPARQHYSPYMGMGNNPVSGVDPDGGFFTDLFDKETGEFIRHIDDGIDQVAFVSQDQASFLGSLWDNGNKDSYFSFLDRVGWMLNWDSDLGKIARTTYGEMSGVGSTSDVDRQVVAESIVNRYNSGLYGDTYSDLLTPDQYNAIGKSAYNDPYGYINGIKSSSPSFYKAKQGDITHNFYNSVTVAYRAYHGIGSKIGNGVVSFVSPPLKSTHFDSDPYLKNITNSISGLKGISGAWGRK
jgi:RHS repeat-associated protein